MDQPRCFACGKEMTPQNSVLCPELFLCDEHAPDELRRDVVIGLTIVLQAQDVKSIADRCDRIKEICDASYTTYGALDKQERIRVLAAEIKALLERKQ